MHRIIDSLIFCQKKIGLKISYNLKVIIFLILRDFLIFFFEFFWSYFKFSLIKIILKI